MLMGISLPPGTLTGGQMKIEIRLAFDEAVMAVELPVRKGAGKMLVLLLVLFRSSCPISENTPA